MKHCNLQEKGNSVDRGLTKNTQCLYQLLAPTITSGHEFAALASYHLPFLNGNSTIIVLCAGWVHNAIKCYLKMV